MSDVEDLIPWSRMHELIFGYPYEMNDAPILKVVQKIGDETGEAILEFAPKVIKQILIEAKKVGLKSDALPYLYYVLDERHHDWPPMGQKGQDGLHLMMEILRQASKMPHYKNALQTPTTEQEHLVDATIDWVSHWTISLASDLYHEYHAILQRHIREAASVSEIKDVDNLNTLVVRSIKRYPAGYSAGTVTRMLFMLVYGNLFN